MTARVPVVSRGCEVKTFQGKYFIFLYLFWFQFRFCCWILRACLLTSISSTYMLFSAIAQSVFMTFFDPLIRHNKRKHNPKTNVRCLILQPLFKKGGGKKCGLDRCEVRKCKILSWQSAWTLWKISWCCKKVALFFYCSEAWKNNCAFTLFSSSLIFLFSFGWRLNLCISASVRFNEYYLSMQRLSQFIHT